MASSLGRVLGGLRIEGSMAEADRLRWNGRYAAGASAQSPVPRLLELEALIRPAAPAAHGDASPASPASTAGLSASSGPLPAPAPLARALDLACGLGRHALYLARLGY